MTRTRCQNRAPIIISSSSSSGSEEAEYSETSESDYEFDGHSVDTLSSTSCEIHPESEESEESEWNESDDERDESTECEEVKEEDSDQHLSKAIHFLRGKGELEDLKLVECKAYLRKHGLRLSGTKEQCVERIMEHWRIKDGKGETFYPRSSFNIDCTGDVCKGDVVLFTQKVYKKFDKITRSGKVSGKRTIAGRIVKESYGAAKQQHTFTVEVLWSQGFKKLPPLFPLLVKGRNLYKLKTFRQRWKNEKERLGVLSEKHRRGAAARLVRETRKMRSMKRKQSLTSKKGAKKRKREEDHIQKRGNNKKTKSHHGRKPKEITSSRPQIPPNRPNVSYHARGKASQPFNSRPDMYHNQGTLFPPQNYGQFGSEDYNQRITYPVSYERAFVCTTDLPHENTSSSVMANRNRREYGRRHHPHP
ncbi:unnamed protein product [Cuscuta epithymum]|uniref:SAP domain-containing protein n=1 Tax=Cuscuta epithymum TaxID=186058 RepID=A0AAV0BZ45_9ASTE|nr:unnamed protein product [Cuscuta epithymum]